MRLDIASINLGPVTTHFTPTANTRVFLDKTSIVAANAVLEDEACTSAQTIPVLYQLKQPSTIWTLSREDSNQMTPSTDKLSSSLFSRIAVLVIKHGRGATLQATDIQDIVAEVKASNLNSLLTDLANTIVTALKRANDKKVAWLHNAAYD
ncbi:uncharacterized protein BYT42DRAFT_646658 [Radiomyces spectabilis]|uniref:uncharacterized protein n=1 Tax=Radiomyces spectabilis TaxID=64574 RepID=UPI002220614B|nr:uncharacterized protein BYT42DRAFT_646658 [Radiomyces spectabilis]KAI8374731.1 hypothetical protein BYT42DRAFT_646658 [Radiomyces spectabilis]